MRPYNGSRSGRPPVAPTLVDRPCRCGAIQQRDGEMSKPPTSPGRMAMRLPPHAGSSTYGRDRWSRGARQDAHLRAAAFRFGVRRVRDGARFDAFEDLPAFSVQRHPVVEGEGVWLVSHAHDRDEAHLTEVVVSPDDRIGPAALTGQWFISGGQPIQYGLPGDVPVPADYNGDGITDIAGWRPSTGGGAFRWLGRTPVQYGQPGDVPVPGYWNDDAVVDIAVWRPSTGQWFI